MLKNGESRAILVTGGAGFVGSSLAIGLKTRHSNWSITAFDNLRRRGSELALSRLSDHGVRFTHGDVRTLADFSELDHFDVLIDCSAEPSVLAGLQGNPSYVIDTNLVGTLNCLEAARKHAASVVFLSTSRVYPIARIEQLPYTEQSTRFVFEPDTNVSGYSPRGIAETFPLDGPRSIYGATKLCSELMIQEYSEAYNLPAIINRCGVITGPWQMGKVDQGVVMHWVASHIFGRALRYIGYGGNGKQVRDILHVDDLLALIDAQLGALEALRGEIFNVGGGSNCSVSLRELSDICQKITGRCVPITSEPETRRADLRIYLTDNSKVSSRFGFFPSATPTSIVDDIARWVIDHRASLERVLFPP